MRSLQNFVRESLFAFYVKFYTLMMLTMMSMVVDAETPTGCYGPSTSVCALHTVRERKEMK